MKGWDGNHSTVESACTLRLSANIWLEIWRAFAGEKVPSDLLRVIKTCWENVGVGRLNLQLQAGVQGSNWGLTDKRSFLL